MPSPKSSPKFEPHRASEHHYRLAKALGDRYAALGNYGRARECYNRAAGIIIPARLFLAFVGYIETGNAQGFSKESRLDIRYPSSR